MDAMHCGCRRCDSINPAGPAPMMPTWVSPLIAQALVRVDDQVQHPEQLALLALVQYRDQRSVHPLGPWRQPGNRPHPGGSQLEAIAPAVALVADTADQATAKQALDDLGGGGPIE